MIKINHSTAAGENSGDAFAYLQQTTLGTVLTYITIRPKSGIYCPAGITDSKALADSSYLCEVVPETYSGRIDKFATQSAGKNEQP